MKTAEEESSNRGFKRLREFVRNAAVKLASAVVKIVYPVAVSGLENVPRHGGALLVANYSAPRDFLVVMAAAPQSVQFLLTDRLKLRGVQNAIARLMAIGTLVSHSRSGELLQGEHTASIALQRGDFVCVFPEGEASLTGFLLPFQLSSLNLALASRVPIVPLYIDRPKGERWSRPVVTFGAALPANASPFTVREAVQDLGAHAWKEHRKSMPPLHRAFICNARRHPLRFAMADAMVPTLSFGESLIKVVFLCRRLSAAWKDQDTVGIMLPPSVACQLVNIAALLLGKVPINLNYTSSADTIARCAEQCRLRTVVTSRLFLERLPVAVPGIPIMMEDIIALPSIRDRLVAILSAAFLPVRLLERSLGRTHTGWSEDAATVIFSSGSTGDPKGVPLTHFNIGVNIEQVDRIFNFRASDRLMCVLPYFHSFGFTINGMLPTVMGVGAVFHSNPLDALTIGALSRRYATSILVGPPSFLQSYVRRCDPEDFRSLRIAIAGAEKLSAQLASQFEERFGIRPLEGYGTTECAPVVAVNTFDVQTSAGRQVGSRPGTIGQPLPGISVRVVNPETLEPVPPGKEGLLMVRGPNVMRGYLDLPEQTAAVMRDGWYSTGDIVAIDEEGFLTITDRMSRFSKIGGEMVPHLRIEEALHHRVNASDRLFAVTAIPDEHRGEALVVFHTLDESRLRDCLDHLSDLGLPNLWVPRRQHFYHLDILPYLGTGKLDLRRLRQLALQMRQNEAA